MVNITDQKAHLQMLMARAKANAERAVAEGRAVQIASATSLQTPIASATAIEDAAKEAEAKRLAEWEEHQGIWMPRYGKRVRLLTPNVTWNAQQLEAIDLALSGESFCLIGPAGTGKTTVTKEIVLQLVACGRIPPLARGTKYLTTGTPGIVICAFTNRAVINSAKPMPVDMKKNCLTIHKLLEFEPRFYEIMGEDGQMRNTMEFAPKFNLFNPLPSSIKVVIDDESSMIGVELYETREKAIQHKVQHIFLGDIQQLPPVFGAAILGFKLLELPTVLLTEVYRQALDSPILRLAHHILKGKMVGATDFPDWHEPGKLTLHAWKKKLDDEHGVRTICAFFRRLIDEGKYDENRDIILVPFNKAFGSIEINKALAQHLGSKREEAGEIGAIVHEVVAGYNKHYYAVGDKVMYNKEDAHIVKIVRNHSYFGKRAQAASRNLDRWGILQEGGAVAKEAVDYATDMDLDDVDAILMRAADATIDDKTNSASHIIDIRLDYGDGSIITLDTSAEVNALMHGYCITVHKAQGSEWRRVFLVLHNSHATMLSRELLYTAITRAREELYVVCEPDTFIKGVRTQRIKGNTLAEKAEYFKGKLTKLQQENGQLLGVTIRGSNEDEDESN